MNAKFGFAALSLALTLAGGDARASFTYSVSPTSTTTTFGGSMLTVTAALNGAPSTTLSGMQNLNLAQITQTSTTVPNASASNTDKTMIPVSLTVAINNLNGGGSSSFLVAGMINVTRSDTQGAASTFTLTSIMPTTITLGSFTYTLSNLVYTAPTIQAGPSGNGGLSVIITEGSTPVLPEPTSVALMGIGLATFGALAVRRRRLAVA